MSAIDPSSSEIADLTRMLQSQQAGADFQQNLQARSPAADPQGPQRPDFQMNGVLAAQDAAKQTAPDLAARFHVSDIPAAQNTDDISKAKSGEGVPEPKKTDGNELPEMTPKAFGRYVLVTMENLNRPGELIQQYMFISGAGKGLGDAASQFEL